MFFEIKKSLAPWKSNSLCTLYNKKGDPPVREPPRATEIKILL